MVEMVENEGGVPLTASPGWTAPFPAIPLLGGLGRR